MTHVSTIGMFISSMKTASFLPIGGPNIFFDLFFTEVSIVRWTSKEDVREETKFEYENMK